MCNKLISHHPKWLAITGVLAVTALAGATNPHYRVRNLVSDGFVHAEVIDPNLVNPWGIVPNPTGVWWVANNGTDTSTLYAGDGTPQSLIVDVPPPMGADAAEPTGIVFNGGSGFVVSNGTASGPARFIFAEQAGAIAAWSPGVPPPPPSTQAFVMVNNSASGASYLGLALGHNATGAFLYAANFAQGTIDVFDDHFQPATLAGSFSDLNLPKDYSPFAIHAIGNSLFVAYAQRGEDGDEEHGVGLGIIDEYDTDGILVRRFASHDVLNAPWGIALAPANFGTFSNALLIGNFGDGRIHAYNLKTGTLLGALPDNRGRPLEIEGLWGIHFGNGGAAGPSNALYFGAGVDDENHGLFGRIDFVPPGHAGGHPH